MTTPETVKEVHERTGQMTLEISAKCAEMLQETKSEVLLNVMMNVGIDLLSKAMAMLPVGSQGQTLQDVVENVIENMRTNRAAIDTYTTLRKAKGIKDDRTI